MGPSPDLNPGASQDGHGLPKFQVILGVCQDHVSNTTSEDAPSVAGTEDYPENINTEVGPPSVSGTRGYEEADSVPF